MNPLRARKDVTNKALSILCYLKHKKPRKWPTGLCLLPFLEVSEEQTQSGISGIIYTCARRFFT